MIKTLIKKGFNLKQKKHYKHAIEVFYKALEEDNKSCEILLEIAELFFLIKNEEKSLSYIEQILKLNETHVGALKLLKTIFLNKKSYQNAEQTAKNIYLITKSEEDLAEVLRLLFVQGKFEEVLTYEINRDNPELVYEKAKSLYKLGKDDEAKSLIIDILEENRDNKELLVFLGQIYYYENNMQECAKIVEKFDTNSNDADVLNFLGIYYSKIGNYKVAEEIFQKVIRTAPNNDEYYYNYAEHCIKFGNLETGKKYYNLAIILNPDSDIYHYSLAKLYYSQKHYKRALEELKGNSFDTKLLKILILCDSGYLALAKKEAEELLKEFPENEVLISCKSKIDKELGLIQ